MKNPLNPFVASVTTVGELLLENLADTLMILGIWLIAVGMGMISLPFGVISMGLASLFAGLLLARAKQPEAD